MGLLSNNEYQNTGGDLFENYDSFCGSFDPDEEVELTSGELNSCGSGDFNMDSNSSALYKSHSAMKHVFDSIKANDGTQSSCSSPQVRMLSASEDTSAETASASEAEPPCFKFDHNTNPISPDEPHKKKYKSKDSEKNRRSRINEKLQELRDLIPKQSSKNLTKEEILIEAIHYIHNLHTQIDKRSRLSAGKESDGSTVVLNSRPQKRARLFMFMFFAIGIGLLAFPFINPPQSHPLYGDNIPRHHSRIIAGAFLCNTTNQNYNVPLGPLLKEIIPYDEDHHCSSQHRGEGKSCVTSEQCDAWQTCDAGHCTTEHLHGHRCSTDTRCSHHLKNKPIKEKKHCSSCFQEIHDKKHSAKINLMCERFGVCHSVLKSDHVFDMYTSSEEETSSSL